MNDNYYMEFGVCEVKFEIRVNDIYVLGESGGTIDSRLPINHLLHKGDNFFSATIRPTSSIPLNEHCTCNLKIINESGEQLGECKYVYDPVHLLNEQHDHFTIHSKFHLFDEVNLPSPWMESHPGTLSSEQVKSLYLKQHEIYNHFKNGDLDAVMQFFEIKNNLYIERYRMQKHQRLEEVRGFYSRFIDDPAWEISLMPEKDWQLKVYGNSKLFSFETNGHFAPLYFNNAEEGTAMVIDVYYFLQNDGQFACAL